MLNFLIASLKIFYVFFLSSETESANRRQLLWS
jgi:hypothetical protein